MFIPATHVPSTPTISFVVDGVPSSTISKYLADEHAIFAANGHFYAYQLAKSWM